MLKIRVEVKAENCVSGRSIVVYNERYQPKKHTFLVSQFTAKLRNVSLSLALSRVGCEMVAQIIISYSRDTYRLFLFFYRQRQCKPNAMKFSSIAEAPPVLFK